MLLQSHDPRGNAAAAAGETAFVHLLPALPSAFPEGKVTGLRARGGFEVDIAWRAGKLEQATLRARFSRPVRIRYAGREIAIRAAAGKVYRFDAELRVR